MVSVETQYGWEDKVRMAAPLLIEGGAGDGRSSHQENLAYAAALSGLTFVYPSSGCRIDSRQDLDNQGKVRSVPELDHRLEAYRRYDRRLGEFLVQVDAEDARLGMADYAIGKHGLKGIELAWGAGRVGREEPTIHSLERALELQGRGCLVTPDPSNPGIQAAYADGAILHFACHSRQGFADAEAFLAECQRLRQLGFKRITWRIAATGLPELATALRWGSEARLDLLTLAVGSPAGADSGVASLSDLLMHSAAAEFSARLATRGRRVPDVAFAGEFGGADHVFKALALAAPFVKAVSLSPAFPCPEDSVSREEVARHVGPDEARRIPREAIGICSGVQRLAAGLRQRMIGARCFSIDSLSRRPLISLTRECAAATRIPYLWDAAREEAEAILDA